MDWSQVLQKFFPQKGIYLVKDDDNILNNETIIEYLEEHQIIVISYVNSVHFRYKLEKRNFKNYDGTILIRLVNTEYRMIPWDIFNNSFKISINYSDILPRFSIKAIREQKINNLEALLEKHIEIKSHLSYEETKEIIKAISYNQIKNFPFNESHDVTMDLNLLNKPDKSFKDWGEIAKLIGKYRFYNPSDQKQAEFIDKSNIDFQKFLNDNFDRNLSMAAFKQPNYLNQIPQFISRNSSKTNKKQALLVFDGMSFTQWYMIEKWLENKGFKTETTPVLAFAPSITSVSRQTIFSGKIPKEFSKSIGTTTKEKDYWLRYWISNGFDPLEIKYQKQLGQKLANKETLEYKYVNTKIYGCVIEVIDGFMHGAVQGLETVQSELKIWLKKGYLEYMLGDLLENDYDIYLTSDHGNVEARGIGRLSEGILTLSRGKRVKVYDNNTLRVNAYNKNYKTTQIWDSKTLPSDYLPLIAKNRLAFEQKNYIVMTHGGTHIEELIVPFVRVTKEDE